MIDIEAKVTEDTKTYAKKIANRDVDVIFSDVLKSAIGNCHRTKSLIRFNREWIHDNKENYDVILQVVIHECCHLVHFNHGKQFKELCKQHGCRNIYAKFREKSVVRKPIPKYYAVCPVCDKTHHRRTKPRNRTSCGSCSRKFDVGRILNFREVEKCE